MQMFFFFVVVLFFRRPRHTLEIAQYGPYTLMFCTGNVSHGRSVTMDWTLWTGGLKSGLPSGLEPNSTSMHRGG